MNLDREIDSNGWTVLVAADVAHRVMLLSSDLYARWSATEPSGGPISSDFHIQQNSRWLLDCPPGRALYAQARSGNQRCAIYVLDPVAKPNGFVWSARRSAAQTITVEWEPSHWGTRPTSLLLDVERQNAARTAWQPVTSLSATVTGDAFAARTRNITGLTAGPRQYRVIVVARAPSGYGPPQVSDPITVRSAV